MPDLGALISGEEGMGGSPNSPMDEGGETQSSVTPVDDETLDEPGVVDDSSASKPIPAESTSEVSQSNGSYHYDSEISMCITFLVSITSLFVASV